MKYDKQKRKKHVCIGTLCIVLVCGIMPGGCGQKQESTKENYPVTIGGVTIDEEPKRAISMSDSIADILVSIGYEMKLVAKTNECSQEEFNILKSVGPANNPDISELKSLAPQVVLFDTEPTEDITAALNEINAKVFVLKAATDRSELEELYSNIGQIMGGKTVGLNHAKEAFKKMFISIDDLTRGVSEETVVTTACYLYSEIGEVATDDSLAGKIIEFAGAVNIAKDPSSNLIGVEELKREDPDFIFCDQGVKEKIMAKGELSNLKAVQEDRVYEIEKILMTRQGGSVYAASKKISSIIVGKESKGTQKSSKAGVSITSPSEKIPNQ